MGRSGLDRVVAVVGVKVAAVPGAAKQRGELASFAAEDMEHGREFLREQKEPAIGGRLLIAQWMEDAACCRASVATFRYTMGSSDNAAEVLSVARRPKRRPAKEHRIS
jgi:hypothetical protein